MSKTYRWDEVRYNKEKVTARERMKRRGAAKICTQRDRLAEREKYSAKHFAFGALWALAVSKGKTTDWWAAKVETLYNREDCRLFDVMRRIGAVYIKFLPHRVGAYRG